MTGGPFFPAPVLAVSGSNAALLTFLLYTLAVFGLAAVSNRLLQKKSFLSEYFLGSRSLGVWAFALTFAATSASGGSFTGFPSLIYTHGWVLGLWIGSYTVVPICAMGLLGKRINHVARISGAITVPDVIRDRFHSAGFGLLAVSLIVFFMSFNLVAQFKAGSEILNTLLRDVPQFQIAVGWFSGVKDSLGVGASVGADYLLCLFVFAFAVIVYTTYGGFHAVVWTDVMQGVVMVAGVAIMLPLAVMAVGGLNNATEQMAAMTPPRVGFARFTFEAPLTRSHAIPSAWFTLPDPESDRPRLFRVARTLAIPAETRTVQDVRIVEITSPGEIDRQLRRLEADADSPALDVDRIQRVQDQVVQLKKLQIEWLRQHAPLDAAGENVRVTVGRLQREIERASNAQTAVLNSPALDAFRVDVTFLKEYAYGSGQPGVYVTGPGPKPPALPQTADEAGTEPDAIRHGFLPLSLAISFFFMWAISGAGQPSSMVRLMAFNSSTTLRRAIFTVAIYYSMIYFPLVIIFCCARVLLPGMDLESDRIMPQVAVTLSSGIDQSWMAGLLIAAPFAAVMSTVDSFLLMISSALVRDIYQRNINPEASERRLKWMSYLFTLLVGTAALMGAINPPKFLQNIIVYTGSGLAACFLGPMAFALYWPRVNTIGAMSGMVAGFLAHLSMYVGGIFVNGSFFEPFRLFNFDPIIVGLVVSFSTVWAATLLTPPPPEELVRKYFYKNSGKTANPG